MSNVIGTIGNFLKPLQGLGPQATAQQWDDALRVCRLLDSIAWKSQRSSASDTASEIVPAWSGLRHVLWGSQVQIRWFQMYYVEKLGRLELPDEEVDVKTVLRPTLVNLEAYLIQTASLNPLLSGALRYFEKFLDEIQTTPPGLMLSPEAIVETNWTEFMQASAVAVHSP